MSQTTTITAELRDRAGKGTARATRRAGQIPAVIYGGKQPPVLLAINAKELEALSRKPGFFTHLFEIKTGKATIQALARDAQRHPISEFLEHVDFLRVDPKTKIHVAIPVKFINSDKAPGIKRGGVLNIVMHKIDMLVNASAIPESLLIDLSGLEINDSIHSTSIQLPAGTSLVSKEEFTVATIAAPSAIRSEMRDKADAPVAEATAAVAAAAPAAGAKAAAPAAGAKAAAPAAGAKAPAAGAAKAPAAKAPAGKK
jgi:large subunit ribosomal protein L25